MRLQGELLVNCQIFGPMKRLTASEGARAGRAIRPSTHPRDELGITKLVLGRPVLFG